MDVVDEFDVGGETPPDKLEELHRLIEEVIALEAAVKQIEADGKAARGALYALKGHYSIPTSGRIPDLMDELGLEALTYKGHSVKVGRSVTGSLPKAPDRKAEAIRWLEDHEAGGLVKTQVSVDFGRSEHNRALDLYETLKQEGLTADLQSNVHPQTLLAFARERLRSGDEIDTDVLGVNVGLVAEIKEPKK